MIPASAWLPLVLGLAAACALCWWVLAPLWRGGQVPTAGNEAALALLGRREAVLASLRDLDADHAAGRMDAESYAPLREQTLEDGRRILAALDRVLGESAGQRAARLRAVEAAVLARRGRSARSGGIESGTAGALASPETRTGVPEGPTAIPSALPGLTLSGLSCTACGIAVQPGDRFCRACGAALGSGSP